MVALLLSSLFSVGSTWLPEADKTAKQEGLHGNDIPALLLEKSSLPACADAPSLQVHFGDHGWLQDRIIVGVHGGKEADLSMGGGCKSSV
jgi:hypothetical protein